MLFSARSTWAPTFRHVDERGRPEVSILPLSSPTCWPSRSRRKECSVGRGSSTIACPVRPVSLDGPQARPFSTTRRCGCPRCLGQMCPAAAADHNHGRVPGRTRPVRHAPGFPGQATDPFGLIEGPLGSPIALPLDTRCPALRGKPNDDRPRPC